MIKAIAVDDEPLALELIETYCKSFDFLQFEKGFSKTAAALLYLEKNGTDLLFLDINMPEMSGFDFLDAMEQLPEIVKHHCRVIMLSSSDSFKDLNRANKNRFVYKFLNKPLTEQVLAAINV